MPPGPKRYAIFLRGINVAGIRVDMRELRSCLEGAGYVDVKTWLNTGNVAVTSTLASAEVKSEVEARLSEQFGYEAHVIVRDVAALSDLVQGYPFETDAHHHRYVLLCEPGAARKALSAIEEAGGPGSSEAVDVSAPASTQTVSEDLYWKCPKGTSTTSPVAKVLARASFKAITTARNLNTLEKMLAGCDRPARPSRQRTTGSSGEASCWPAVCMISASEPPRRPCLNSARATTTAATPTLNQRF